MKYATPRYTDNKGLNKAHLPDVKDYLQSVGIVTKGRTLWVKAKCPFHDDQDPSLSINTLEGCFKCFSCGAKGGDLIAFHMKLKGIGFNDACKELGAWEK